MKDIWDKALGVVVISVVAYYVFRDMSGSVNLMNSFSNMWTGGIKALQGRN